MSFTLQLSPDNPNTRTNAEETFGTGQWEQRGGRRQTRLFAEYFHRHVTVPFAGDFSVLDVGCALGDAAAVWHKAYPRARLFGCDVSQVAVDRATQDYGSIASFTRSSFEEIEGMYDVIFCSNVLEHFEQHVAIARELLTHCKILYAMTPYAELNNGRPMAPAPGAIHVATFLEDTFASLGQGADVRITTKVIRCPIAWGPRFPTEVLWHIKYALGLIHAPSPPRRQIIYTMSHA